jgi:hypothetical protein
MGWTAKAKQAAATLKAEYEAGKRGDQAPAQQIWSTPKEQLDGIVALLRSSRGSRAEPSAAVADPVNGPVSNPVSNPASNPASNEFEAVEVEVAPAVEVAPEAEVEEIAAALQGVDWAGVRSATSERTSDATKAVRAMAEQVDWAKLQPVASQVSRALIAAVAAGQIPVGGRVGATVAKAITDQGGLGQRVVEKLDASASPLPEEFRRAINVSSRPIDTPSPPARTP